MPGSTPNFSFSYPLLTDAADIESFGVKPIALALDTLLAVGQQVIVERHGSMYSGRSADTRYFSGLDDSGSSPDALQIPGNGRSGAGVFYINPARYPTTAKLSVAASLLINNVAPTGNFTFGLYPVSAPSSAIPSALDITAGTVVSGSTAAINTPAANSLNHQESSEFAVPTAGFYTLGVVTTSTIASNSRAESRVRLEVRWGG